MQARKDVYIERTLGYAAYSRSKEVVVGMFTCDDCGEEAATLSCDTSEGEYGPVVMCMPCIEAMFARYHQSAAT
jgi:hypothetical protein